MSKLQRAIEILEALNDFFQERDGQVVLYSDSQILEDDVSIKDAIAECVGMQERDLMPVVPRSKRPRVNCYMGFYSGWLGKRKVARFNSAEEAQAWLKSQEQ